LKGMMPVWYALVILFRDVLILIGGLYLSKKIKFVVPSDYIGKATVLLIGFTLLMLLFNVEYAVLPSLIVSALACVFSLVNYLRRMVKLLKENNIKA